MNDNNAIWGNTLETGLKKDELKNKVTSVNGKNGEVTLTAKDIFTEADKAEIAQEAASLIDTSLLSAIGNGVLE